HVLSSLSQGAFRHLVSAVRADTGVKAGRYLFELKVLEKVPGARHKLCIGLSTSRSSLFLGDGSPDGLGFGSDGTYYSAEPGQLRPLELSAACKPMLPHQVVGLLLNMDKDSPNSYTVSVFLDGVRAGPPQPIPVHLRGKALYPTVTFQNMTLTMNFGHGGRQLKPLPFRCRLFAQMLSDHHELAPLRKQPGCEV
ncbi:unnamed protein product, partial [Polarella glacialis]